MCVCVRACEHTACTSVTGLLCDCEHAAKDAEASVCQCESCLHIHNRVAAFFTSPVLHVPVSFPQTLTLSLHD